jgi:hypothetical protein
MAVSATGGSGSVTTPVTGSDLYASGDAGDMTTEGED